MYYAMGRSGSFLRRECYSTLPDFRLFLRIALTLVTTRASRSTCTPRKHYCEMTDNTNAHVAIVAHVASCAHIYINININKTYYTSQREIWQDISRAEGE